jgi:hypothetical protein
LGFLQQVLEVNALHLALQQVGVGCFAAQRLLARLKNQQPPPGTIDLVLVEIQVDLSEVAPIE